MNSVIAALTFLGGIMELDRDPHEQCEFNDCAHCDMRHIEPVYREWVYVHRDDCPVVEWAELKERMEP